MSSKFLKPSVTIPASYGLSLLDALLDKGLGEADLLQGTHLDRAILQNRRGRIALSQYATLLVNARKLGSLDGLAYELGLRSQVTRHGFVGFGIMSCVNLREAIAFSERYFQARLAGAFIPHVSVEGEEVVVSLRENMLLSDEFRIFTLDMVLIELCSLFARIRGSDPEVNGWKCEIWVPHAEPPAYARHKQRLPRFRFNQAAAQIRFPAGMLDQPIATADPVSVQLAIERCESEMPATGATNDFSAQVLARMVCHGGRYPNVDDISRWLCVSERTLKRRLQDEGSSFQGLLDRVRRQDSESMLVNPTLSIKEVAEAVGYADASNFSRAFVKWTGCSPRAWRRQRGMG